MVAIFWYIFAILGSLWSTCSWGGCRDRVSFDEAMEDKTKKAVYKHTHPTPTPRVAQSYVGMTLNSNFRVFHIQMQSIYICYLFIHDFAIYKWYFFMVSYFLYFLFSIIIQNTKVQTGTEVRKCRLKWRSHWSHVAGFPELLGIL